MTRGLVWLAGIALVIGLAPPAGADLRHPSVVRTDPVDVTPQLIPTSGVERPRIDAFARRGDTVYAAGWFQRVRQGGRTYDRANIVAFDADTGAVRSFAPRVNGRIWALVVAQDSLYIGGEFSAVNGVARPNLVRVDPATGQVRRAFRAGLDGRVNTLAASDGRLFVGGAFGRKLAALNLATGAGTGYFPLPITNPIPNAWGRVAVYALAIDRAGKRLVATGNFRTVAGQPRSRLFVARLGRSSARLGSWYYEGFARPCVSTNPRRVAYLQGVDWSPDGSYFVVVSTGQVSRQGDLGRTVCDAAGRFDLDDENRPRWINYTGGDSVWSVSATGAAVYVQGHFTYLNNGGGWQGHPVPTAVRRRGVGAINPVTGKALRWNPGKPARVGGRAFLATKAGLWVGSDSLQFAGESHRGLAFCRLP